MIGYFIWCWNDEEWLGPCLNSFRETTEDIYLIGILNASEDDSGGYYHEYTNEYWSSEEPLSMSQCVNQGYTRLYELDCEYMGWIHPDMLFHQKGWVDVLKQTLIAYPQIGRISPYNIKYDPIPPQIYPGAEAGNLIHRDKWDLIGPWDEAYIGCGGYEDWDIQQRFIEHGLGSCITTEASMWHHHVGTRHKIDHDIRHQQWAYNQGIYSNKWKTYDNAMVPDGWEVISLTR